MVLTHNTMYGLMLTLAMWTTLIHGIGSTASLQVAVMHCWIYLALATVVEELFLFMFVWLFVCKITGKQKFQIMQFTELSPDIGRSHNR